METKLSYINKYGAEVAREDQSHIVDAFCGLLYDKIHEAKDQLIDRFNWIASQDPKSASFMYDNHTMAGYKKEEGIRSALMHGTLAIGSLGLAETLEILIGCNHTKPEGMELGKRIYKMFEDLCSQFKKEYKLNFGVYLTPAENLAFTAMKKFQAKYGVIPKVSDKEYFTNSIHVPVWENVDPFEKVEIESQLTGYSSAGCITYVELEGSVINNIEALEEIVDDMMEKDIPYGAINIPNDFCEECSFTGYIPEDLCPQCGCTRIKRLARVTG